MPPRFVEVPDPIADGADAVNGLAERLHSLLAWLNEALSAAKDAPFVDGAVEWGSRILQNKSAEWRERIARSAGDYVDETILNRVSQFPLPDGTAKTLLSFSVAVLVARLLYVRSRERHLVSKHGFST